MENAYNTQILSHMIESYISVSFIWYLLNHQVIYSFCKAQEKKKKRIQLLNLFNPSHAE